MKFVDLKLNISVDFSTMTMEQYKRIELFFNSALNNQTINNQELIEFLNLDKRPFAVCSIKSPRPSEDKLISNAEIDLIC